MKWHITRKRLALTIVVLAAILVALALTSCEYRVTEPQEAAIQHTAGAAGGIFGLPPVVGESLAGAVLSAISYFMGHKRATTRTRKAQPPTLNP